MEYTKTVWKDLPDTSTPITADRLNNLENGVEYLFQNESSHGINEYSQSTTDSYSCNYVNQKTLKKLWENTNTTTSFSPQTITLSSEDYDYLVWIYRFNTASNNNIQKSQLVLKGAGVIMDIAWDYGVGGSYTVADYYRKVQYTNNTTYSSGDCNIKYNNTQDAQDNNFIIPVAVYGGKF